MKSIVKILEKYWLFVALGAGMVTAILAMVLSLRQSIWFDEGYSILLAKQPVGELLALTAVDAHPPLYYLLLKAWGEMFGFTEFALRSLSALFLGGAVTTMLLLIRRLFGTRVALVTIPVLILAPFALRYGYEVRMYALAGLIGVVATYALVRAHESTNNRWWVVYTALVALGMYTLYMTLAVWVAHVVWLLWVSFRDKKARPIWKWKWLYAYVGAVVLFAPYIPTFFYQLENSALPGIGREVTLTSVVDMTTMTTLYTAEWAMGGWLSLVVVGLVVALISVAVVVYKKLPKKQKASFGFLLTLVVVPVLFFAITSLPPRPPVYVVRYIAHVVLFGYATVGVIIGLYWAQTKTRRFLAPLLLASTVIVLAMGVSSLAKTGNFNFERMQDPHTAELRSTVSCTDDTVVVADDPYTFIDSAFYYDTCDFRFYSKDNVARAGGYAMLHNSPLRVDSSSKLTQSRIIHLHWTGHDAAFTLDARYKLVDTVTRDKQIVDTYERIEE